MWEKYQVNDCDGVKSPENEVAKITDGHEQKGFADVGVFGNLREGVEDLPNGGKLSFFWGAISHEKQNDQTWTQVENSQNVKEKLVS